jgi:hypothetical protein
MPCSRAAAASSVSGTRSTRSTSSRTRPSRTTNNRHTADDPIGLSPPEGDVAQDHDPCRERAHREHRARDGHVVLRDALLDEVADDHEQHQLESGHLRQFAASDGAGHEKQKPEDRRRSQDELHQGMTHVRNETPTTGVTPFISWTVPAFPHC